MTAKEKKVIFIFKKVFKKKDININSNIGNINNGIKTINKNNEKKKSINLIYITFFRLNIFLY